MVNDRPCRKNLPTGPTLFGPVIFEIEKERKALISCFERVMALGLSRLVEIPFLSFGKPKEEE